MSQQKRLSKNNHHDTTHGEHRRNHHLPYHELHPCGEHLYSLFHRNGQGCRVHGYRSCHRPLHPVACLHGKAALGTGTQHGD